jgi:hypothetical protein
LLVKHGETTIFVGHSSSKSGWVLTPLLEASRGGQRSADQGGAPGCGDWCVWDVRKSQLNQLGTDQWRLLEDDVPMFLWWKMYGDMWMLGFPLMIIYIKLYLYIFYVYIEYIYI